MQESLLAWYVKHRVPEFQIGPEETDMKNVRRMVMCADVSEVQRDDKTGQDD